MRNLLAFFLRNFFFFLFLMLEAVCFTLIFNHSYYQRSSIIRSTNRITGNLNQVYTDITEYLYLKKGNELLAEENVVLHSMIKVDTNLSCQSSLIQDTVFHYISAKVISNSVNRRNNYFMINKGIVHGVEKDMGVISTEGIAGIIVGVSENFSTAMSLLHKDARISGKIKKNNQMVSISWGGRNFRAGNIEDIPTHIQLYPGDTIITSGHSHIFPEGIPIGITEQFIERQNQLFNTGTLWFSTDFSSLYYVYVIRNNFREELLQHNMMPIYD